ncbi:PucR family transcriptional regulator ligand-binding domain-containing protein, partial [Streptomyces sp. NPDC059656]
MRVRDLLDMPELRLTALDDGGAAGLDRELRWVYTTDLLEPADFLAGGELVLTSEGWYRTPADCETFAASLAQGAAAALVAGDILLGEVPPALVDACRRHGIPILAVPADISYSALSRTVIDRINRERGRVLADVLGHHRRLVTALVDGADLGGLVAMLSTELGTPCWALSTAGRLLAGPGEELSAAVRGRLAAHALRAERLPATEEGHTLLPIGRRSAGGGLLVIRGTPDDTGTAAQTAELLALGGARRDERRRTEQRFHAQLVELLDQQAPPTAVSARLRTAGLATDRPLVAVTALTRGALRSWDLAADLVEST